MAPTVRLELAPAFPNPTVIQEAHLNWADVNNNHNKYYQIYLEKSSDNQYRVRTHYGRHGRGDGVTEIRAQGSNERAARLAFEEQYRKKTSKGYRELDVIAGPTAGAARTEKSLGGTTISVVAVTRDGTPQRATMLSGMDAYRQGIRAPTTWSPPAQQFYNQLLSEAASLVDTGTQIQGITAAGIETALGVLSDRHLQTAERVLIDLAAAITRKDSYETDRLNSEFYTLIPTPAGQNMRAARMLDLPSVQAKQDLVRAMRDVLAQHVQAAQDAEAKRKGKRKKKSDPQDSYPLKLSEASEQEHKAILDLLHAKTCRCHDTRAYKLEHLWKVERPAEIAAFERDLGNPKLLFHGTRRTSAAGILSRGLLPSKDACASGGSFSGSAFGGGIYLADNWAKSAGYCGGEKAGRRIMFVVLTALGQSQQASSGNGRNTESLPPGYHSVHGVTGSYLKHDEFIVRRPSQTVITHVLAL